MQKIIALSAIILLSGCASVGSTQLKPSEPKAPNCQLDIYSSKEEIKRPYESVCVIDSRTGTSAFDDKSAAGAIRLSKPKACQCGADAILIEQMDTEGMTFMTWGKGKAIVRGIRYR